MLFAKKIGLHNNESYREYNVPEREGEVKFLELDEVKQLVEVEVKSSMERKARDLMLFACYTGMRYSDIQNLRIADIKQHNFKDIEQVFYAAHIRQVKTNNLNTVPLLPEALAIIKKYDGKTGEFALPRMALQVVNEVVKNVGMKAGLNAQQRVDRFIGIKRETTYIEKWKLLSTHMGRRTFVTIAANHGLPIPIVASITGQNPMTTMRHYMGVLKPDKFQELAAKMKF